MNEHNANPQDIRPSLNPDERAKLEQLSVTDPDDLLKPAERTGVSLWLVVSVLAHAVIIGVTSLALFGDWMEYGFLMPAEIDQIKQEQADQQKLKEQQAARAAAAAAAAENEKPNDKPGDTPTTGANAYNTSTTTNDATKPDPDEPIAPPEPESADPIEEFKLDENDLGL